MPSELSSKRRTQLRKASETSMSRSSPSIRHSAEYQADVSPEANPFTDFAASRNISSGFAKHLRLFTPPPAVTRKLKYGPVCRRELPFVRERARLPCRSSHPAST